MLPLIAHLAGAALFALGAIGQFRPRLRRRRPAWHRRAGRLVAAAGLLVAASALWMTLFHEPQAGTGGLLVGFRLVFGTAFAACLLLGVAAVRRGDIAAHRAWMVRGYALGMGAATQIFTEGFTEAVFGSGVLSGDLAKGAAWIINLGLAEWVLRRRRAPSFRPRQAGALA